MNQSTGTPTNITPYRMRTLIEDAPHAETCSRIQAIALEISGVDCDCWKAEAL